MIDTISRRVRRAAALSAALVAALILALITAPAAHAAPQPAGPFTIEITKLEQPDALGQPANGLPIADAAAISPPVPDAEFSAWRVPGVDLSTNAGQQQAALLTPEAAAALVDTSSVPDARDITDNDGEATLDGLAIGIYYVAETSVPAGFVGSAPFLVALPLTNPVSLDGWLDTVHIYPKNSRVGIELQVFDANSVKLGDVVEWLSRSDIPNSGPIDGYRVEQQIDPKLRLLSGPGDIAVTLSGTGAPALVEGTHYTLSVDPATQLITIDFLPTGRTLLSQFVGAHPGAKVDIGYRTEVQDLGELTNRSLLYPSRAAIDAAPGSPAPPSATATTKWGALAAVVHERGNPSNLIRGAKFKLYLSEADARSGTNPIEVAGMSEWTSDAQGLLRIDGLRLSNFANGLDRDQSDPLYRYYYLAPVFFPAGWTGDTSPIRTTVTSTTQVNVLEVLLWRSGGGGGLPSTGAQMTGAAIVAALLIGAGVLFFLRRRRAEDEEETTNS